jgi:hypothetical protein
MSSFTTPEAQFLVQSSCRITDHAVYLQILSDYGITGNGGLLFGVSPTTLRNRYNLNYVDNPTSSDYQNLTPTGCVFTTSAAAASQVLGHTVSGLADGVQTLSGVSYTDPNGQLFTSVTWEWYAEVVFFNVATDKVAAWDQQVVTWAGDNAATRVIPTTFALNDGASVAVIAFPLASLSSPSAAISSVAGTILSRNPADTTQGVTSLGATGFTIKTGGSVNINAVGTNYYAIVLKSSGNSPQMKQGSYVGLGAKSGNIICAIGTKNITTGFTMTANDVGRTLVIASSQSVTIASFIDATHITISANALFDGLQTGSIGAGGQTITVGGSVAPKMIWVFNRTSTGALYTSDMPNGTSVGFANEAKATNVMITNVAVDPTLGAQFTLGSDNNVNIDAQTGWWVSFQFDPTDAALGGIHVFTGTGTGGSVSVTGFGFQPAFAYAREALAASTKAAHRGPTQAGAHSQTFDGADIVSTGITSLDSNGITVNSNVAVASNPFYGFALKSTLSTTQFPTPTYKDPTCTDAGDGTTTCVDNPTVSNTPPTGAPPEAPVPTYTPTWWCNVRTGESIFQMDSPGSDWTACSGPATNDGWYHSQDGFGRVPFTVCGGQPADPRAWLDIVGWATGNTGMLGGSPGAACIQDNHLVYPGGDYTVSTSSPTIRIFDGHVDRLLTTVPKSASNVVAKAVMSVLAANGTVYLSTWDSGTSSADWVGRVFQLDTVSGDLTLLGTTFAAGEMPYALAWHMGRLWCGTNNGIGTVGKIYFFRPGIDTAWTLDHATSSDSAGGVDSMVSYKGKLYVGTDNAAASRGKVLVRDTAGAYTTSQTGAGGTNAVVNNGYLQLTVFGSNLYASYWNNDTTAYSKIEKFDGTTWSNSFVGATTTIKPYIILAVDDGALYAFGGGKLLAAAIVSTLDGITWTNLSAELPETDTTLLPLFGVVVT